MDKNLDTQPIQPIHALIREFSDTTVFLHEAIAKKAGLSGSDHKYLGLLMQNGSMTAGELSKLTGLTTGAVTGLIDRLEKKELAKRAFDPQDRRKIIIIPNTENAMTLLGDIFGELQSKTANIISNLNENETKIIERYLISTIEVMKEVTNNLNQ